MLSLKPQRAVESAKHPRASAVVVFVLLAATGAEAGTFEGLKPAGGGGFGELVGGNRLSAGGGAQQEVELVEKNPRLILLK